MVSEKCEEISCAEKCIQNDLWRHESTEYDPSLYLIKIFAYYLINCMDDEQVKLNFELIYKYKDIEGFNDIVLRCSTDPENREAFSNSLFAMQCDDKGSDSISWETLVSESEKDFNIIRYFQSYRKILQTKRFKDRIANLIILTNNSFDSDILGKYLDEKEIDSGCLTFCKAKCYQFNQMFLEKLLPILHHINLGKLADYMMKCFVQNIPLSPDDEELLVDYQQMLISEVFDACESQKVKLRKDFLKYSVLSETTNKFRDLLQIECNKAHAKGLIPNNCLCDLIFKVPDNFCKTSSSVLNVCWLDNLLMQAYLKSFLDLLVIVVQPPNEVELNVIIQQKLQSLAGRCNDVSLSISNSSFINTISNAINSSQHIIFEYERVLQLLSSSSTDTDQNKLKTSIDQFINNKTLHSLFIETERQAIRLASFEVGIILRNMGIHFDVLKTSDDDWNINEATKLLIVECIPYNTSTQMIKDKILQLIHATKTMKVLLICGDKISSEIKDFFAKCLTPSAGVRSIQINQDSSPMSQNPNFQEYFRAMSQRGEEQAADKQFLTDNLLEQLTSFDNGEANLTVEIFQKIIDFMEHMKIQRILTDTEWQRLVRDSVIKENFIFYATTQRNFSIFKAYFEFVRVYVADEWMNFVSASTSHHFNFLHPIDVSEEFLEWLQVIATPAIKWEMYLQRSSAFASNLTPMEVAASYQRYDVLEKYLNDLIKMAETDAALHPKCLLETLCKLVYWNSTQFLISWCQRMSSGTTILRDVLTRRNSLNLNPVQFFSFLGYYDNLRESLTHAFASFDTTVLTEMTGIQSSQKLNEMRDKLKLNEMHSIARTVMAAVIENAPENEFAAILSSRELRTGDDKEEVYHYYRYGILTKAAIFKPQIATFLFMQMKDKELCENTELLQKALAIHSDHKIEKLLKIERI